VEGAVESILEGLTWLGLDWDEGPVFQSDRLPLYREAADELVSTGAAYHCFCSSERLEQVRAEQARQKLPPRYDGLCRGISPAEAARRIADGEHSVVRFKTPVEGETTFDDLITWARDIQQCNAERLRSVEVRWLPHVSPGERGR
jgi:glutamyl-tRNA synthetase